MAIDNGGITIRRLFWVKRFRHCGSNVKFGDHCTVMGWNNISIGNNNNFISDGYLYSHGDGSIKIGNNCGFSHNTIINSADGGIIEIGDDVLVGPNSVLRASDHVFSDPEILIRKQGHCGGKIIIENDVWIASNVVITKNVKIGRGCVIGAGSVVTHNLPEMTVCVGIPAEPIKHRGE